MNWGISMENLSNPEMRTLALSVQVGHFTFTSVPRAFLPPFTHFFGVGRRVRLLYLRIGIVE